MSHIPKYIKNEDFMAPLQPIKAGKTSEPEVLVNGGVVSTIAKIVFTGNLIAGDTVTINGAVFTAKASGAAGQFQFNVDTTLALSLTALAVVLNACTDTRVSHATYTVTDTNSAITATSDTYGLGTVVASTHSTVVLTQSANGKLPVYASMDFEHTQINFPSAFTATVLLPDGDESQRKTIAMLGLGTCNIVSPTDMLPGTTNNYALNGADVLVLQWLAGKWRLILNDGAVAS